MLLVRIVTFFQKIIFNSLYEKNIIFFLYRLIQDLPYVFFFYFFQRVLVLVAFDVDALCACKILQVRIGHLLPSRSAKLF